MIKSEEQVSKETKLIHNIYETINQMLAEHDLCVHDALFLASTAMGAVIANGHHESETHEVLGRCLETIAKAYAHFSGCEIEIEKCGEESGLKFEYDGEHT